MEFQRDRSSLFAAGLTAVGSFLVGWICAWLEPGATFHVSWRPNAGLLLGILLIQPRSRWPILLLAVWPIEFFLALLQSHPSSLWSCVCLATFRVGAVVLAAHLMESFVPGRVRFERLREVFCLILYPCLLVSLTSACLEVLLLPQAEDRAGIMSHSLQLWSRDWLGYFIVTPGVVIVERLFGRRPNWTLSQGFSAGSLIVVSAIVGWLAFRSDRNDWPEPGLLLYLPFVVFVWAALRFGSTGVVGCSLTLAAMMTALAGARPGPLPIREGFQRSQIPIVPLCLLVSSGMGLILAAANRERELAITALGERNQQLQQMADNFRRAESELRETEDLYRRAITAANAVPYLREYQKDHFTFIGEGIERLTGYSVSEMTPKVWEALALEHILWGEVAGLRYEEAVRRTRLGEFRNWQSDALIMTRQGHQRWVSDTSVEFSDASGKPAGSIGILMDVTDRKHAEHAMRLANAGLEGRIIERPAELEAAVRELEGFTYSVSHDLRAPLRAIEGFSRILQEDHAKELGVEPARLLRRIRSAAVRMDVLINSLLAFSQLSRQPLSRQNTDLNLFVREALEELRLEQQGRKIQVQHHDLPLCYGDPELLRQVIRSFISNALKYTRRREVTTIEIGYDTSSGETAYYVRDNGAGFDMAYADKLFGVFQRMHRSEDYEGTGVGLAISQRIIRRHGGKIWAAAELDKGATFFFTVAPMNTPPAMEQETGGGSLSEDGGQIQGYC